MSDKKVKYKTEEFIQRLKEFPECTIIEVVGTYHNEEDYHLSNVEFIKILQSIKVPIILREKTKFTILYNCSKMYTTTT